MAHGGDKEIEIKLRVDDVAALQERLRRLRARPGGRVHEANMLFDFPDDSLRSRGMLLRLRVESPVGRRRRPARHSGEPRRALEARIFPHKGERAAIVTWKGPAETPPAGGQSAYKVRREVEFTATSSRAMREVLLALGLRPAFCYEKIRTTFHLPREPHLVVTLDETPAGAFVELEGRPAAIDRVRRALGYQESDAILLSYGALFAELCRARGVPMGDMLF